MTAKKNKTVFFIPLLMLILIIASVLLRIPVYSYVRDNGSDNFTDPETGSFYLTEMDSYYHLRMTKDILDHGHAGDALKDGHPWDSLSYAPEGRSAADYRPLMAHIAASAYRIISLFTDISIEQVAYWLNVFLSALVIIPVFLLTRELGNTYAAIAASILSALNYGYFIHTVPGFYDTDAVIAWTSCFFIYFGCMMIKKAEAKERKALILNTAGFIISAILLYSGWYVYYLFVFIAAAAFFIYAALKYKKGKAKSVAFPALSSLIFILLVFILEPGLIITIRDTLANIYSKGAGLFPDIYVSVSEMKKTVLLTGGLTGLFQMKVLSGNNIGLINAAGGLIPFAAAITGLVFIIKSIIKKNFSAEHILLLIWYGITLVLAFRGWRFIMLFAIPNAILAGYFTGWVCEQMDKGKMMDRGLYKVMLILLMCFPSIYGSYRSFSDSLPTVDQGLGNTLTKIKKETPDNTLLASWWDYGYFFEEKAGRKSLFDGGSQSGMRCYFAAKAFATDNEILSANIFRMLSASGDEACRMMLDTFGENEDTLILMDNLLGITKTKAAELLMTKDIDDVRRTELLKLLFPEHIDQTEVLITPHMSRIAEWFADFGMSMGADTLERAKYSVVLNKVSVSLPSEGRSVYSTDHGFEIVIEKNPYGLNAYTRVSEKDNTAPYKIGKVMYLKDNVFSEYAVSENISDSDYCMIVEEHGDTAYLSMTTLPLASSVLGRLYYAYGAGLTEYSFESSLSEGALVYRLKEVQ